MFNIILNGECDLIFIWKAGNSHWRVHLSSLYPTAWLPFGRSGHGEGFVGCYGGHGGADVEDDIGGYDVHDDAVGETDTTFIQFVFSEKLRSGQQQFILKKSTEGTNLSTKATTPYSEIQVSKKLNMFLFWQHKIFIGSAQGWWRMADWGRWHDRGFFLACSHIQGLIVKMCVCLISQS